MDRLEVWQQVLACASEALSSRIADLRCDVARPSPQSTEPHRVHLPFLPRCSSGTASGEFPRPAASRRLLFRLLPKIPKRSPKICSCPSRKAVARFGSGPLSPFSAPSQKGRKRRNKMYFNSIQIIGFLGQRPGATPSACQRRGVHRSFGRHTAVMEERARRVGLEDRMASRRRVEQPRRARCGIASPGRSHPGRRHARQQHLRP